MVNKFYIAKDNTSITIFAGYSCSNGAIVKTDNNKISSTADLVPITEYKRLVINADYKYATHSNYYWLDKNKRVIKAELLAPQKIDEEVPDGAYYFAIEFVFSKDNSGWDDVSCNMYKQITPHYKSLKKQYKKESNQMFFRETLDGKISLFGSDYEYVNSCSINDKILFAIYQNDNRYVSAFFNKSDCKFNHFRKSVELKLEACDSYTNILNKYENTYDIIKLAPARSQLTLTKRGIIQIYVQGENVITSYAGGTYWETDINESIDDADALLNKYHFSKGPAFREINLSGFNYDINTSFSCIRTMSYWNSNSHTEKDGIKYEIPCSIKFTKVYDANETLPSNFNANNILLLKDGKSAGTRASSAGGAHDTEGIKTLYDTYRIEIYTDKNGAGTKIYQSDKLYGVVNGDFIIAQGSDLYSMTSIPQSTPQKNPTPEKFNLGDKVIEYNTWARLVCDTSELADGTKTYDLLYDDFAITRVNYKKCIGLTGFNTDNSVVKLYQNTAASEEPTPYGMNDFGLYFKPPLSRYTEKSVYPLARSTWGNTSLWAVLETNSIPSLNYYETWCKKSYKRYTIKDCYGIGNVIKALLKEIDITIKHEPTEEFSKFLYGTDIVASSDKLKGCQLYITQKTNILKGEYDQAAQKAEITLKNIMDMLRDCFRCYWYIDKNNRFIIEHVTYFTNGFSYNSPNIEIDCTKLADKFNKKNIQYDQQEIEYDKSNLQSRFEFTWTDNSTDAMGGNFAIDIKDEYMQKNNTESITPDMFSTDIDYMLFLPSDFSEDGFALLAANSNSLVPISSGFTLKGNSSYINDSIVTPQNYVLSWNNLIYHYMSDMPGNIIEYNNLPENSLYVDNIRKCMKHEIELQGIKNDPDITKIIKTSFGNGYIDSMSSNVDTKLVNITLMYEPK